MVILALIVAGIGCVVALPYHVQIAAILSVTTFTSALIFPFLPGRPYLWEFAGLLAWSGLAVTFCFRQQHSGMRSMVRENRWLFLGILGYCIILIVTMCYRGFGLRVLGSEQMGGRFYFQQLVCAVFPLLFAARPMTEKILVRLFIIQCAMTATYLISDFAFSLAPRGFFFLLQFFELPNDALNFEGQVNRFGIRRFQSFYLLSTGLILVLLIKFQLRDFLSRRAFYLVPLSGLLFGIGLMSGHRYLSIILGSTVLLCAYAQRFSTFKNNMIIGSAALLLLFFAYSFANHLPLAAQRAASFLPGIGVNQEAKADAAATLEARRIMRRVGMDLAPQYFWVGRGFGQSTSADLSTVWDRTGITPLVNAGRFYNGFIGLLVNTGGFGTLFMLSFIGAGSMLAARIIRHLRVNGCEDPFSRMCSVAASIWLANVIAFLFFHGDSEWAMKTFTLQAGLLLACDYHLKQRLKA